MSWVTSPRRAPQPGDVMLHPVVAAAICVLLANDHILKQRFPGPATGILSDIAGLIFFPMVLVATVELLGGTVGRTRTVALCIALTGVVYVGGEVLPAVRIALEEAWGWSRTAIGGGRPVVFTADPTDLLALPALGVSWIIGRRRSSRATAEAVAPVDPEGRDLGGGRPSLPAASWKT